MSSKRLDTLVQALTCLPSVGQKTAQRMAIHLLQHNRHAGAELAMALDDAMLGVKHCQRCRNFSDDDLCDICQDPARHSQLLCVVEGPADVLAIEQSTDYRGEYFVLMGHLSPLDGIGPEEIGLDVLVQRFRDDAPEEVILATNITVEGDATAYFISEHAKAHNIKTSRIAYGVPAGGELEYIDQNTLGHAFAKRTLFDS